MVIDDSVPERPEDIARREKVVAHSRAADQKLSEITRAIRYVLSEVKDLSAVTPEVIKEFAPSLPGIITRKNLQQKHPQKSP